MTPANRVDLEWLEREISSLEIRIAIKAARLAECKAALAELHKPERPANPKPKQKVN